MRLGVFGFSLALIASLHAAPSQAQTGFDEVSGIFETKCVSCHGGTEQSGDLRLDSWSHVMAGADDGEVVIPFAPDHSLLIELATKLQPLPHPAELEDGAGDTLTVAEIDRIREWIEAGAMNDKGEVPYSDATNLLYATNEGEASISVIDMDANVVVRRVDLVDLGFSPNARPHHVAVEPDGEHWYVSLIGDDHVLKFNRQNELVGRAEFERPGMLVVDTEGDQLVVGRSMKAVNPPQRIGVVERSSMEVEEVDVFIARPHALALSADGRFVYTASLAANQVVTMNRETDQVDLYNIPGPTHTLVQFAVSPDGSTVAVGGQMTAKLLFFDVSSPDAPVVFDSVNVAAAPWHPVYSRDGKFIYFGNKMANKVTVVDAEARAVAAEIGGRGIAMPHGSALSPDGRYLYISNNNTHGHYKPRFDLGDNATVGTVVVIDTSSRRIVKVLEVGQNTTGLGAVSAG